MMADEMLPFIVTKVLRVCLQRHFGDRLKVERAAPTLVLKFPAVVVARGNEPGKTRGTHLLYCSAETACEAADIAAEVFREMFVLEPAVKAALGLKVMKVRSVGPVNTVDGKYYAIRVDVYWSKDHY